MANNKFVVRCEGERLKGWQVRIPSWHPEGPSSKFFSDSQHGGKRGGLKAAKTYRDVVFEGHELSVSQKKRHHSKQNNNQSMLLGVSLARHHTASRQGQTKDPDTGYLYWVAYWSPQSGDQKKKRFAVAKFGFVDAWERAVALRQKMTGQAFEPEQLQQGREYCLNYWGALAAKGIFYPERVALKI